MHRIRGASLILVMLTALAGCGSEQGTPAAEVAPETAVLESEEAFPTDDLSQWVSYPAQVSVVRLSNEREMPREAELAETGAGYLGRLVTVTVESTLWTNLDEAPLPESFDMRIHGWIVDQAGNRRPAQAAGSPRLEIGKRYVMPLTRFFNDIGPLSSHSLAELDADDRVILSPGQRDPVVERFAGLSVSELRSSVRSARPDPIAKKYKGLPPYERAQAVLNERSAGQGK